MSIHIDLNDQDVDDPICCPVCCEDLGDGPYIVVNGWRMCQRDAETAQHRMTLTPAERDAGRTRRRPHRLSPPA